MPDDTDVTAWRLSDPNVTRTLPGGSQPASDCPTVPGYELFDKIGQGGMGVVYRARQVRANRDVALKMILTGDGASVLQLARFRLEAEAVAGLHHPHIVTVYEVGEHGGQPFFSMEYCPNGSLKAFTQGKTLDLEQVASLVLKLARGMSAAHLAGIIHRDLKPHNVLMSAEGEPKVTDFGLAKYVNDAEHEGLTRTVDVMGTPAYMAPEQALGTSKYVGPAADVYALGAILYELLTGRPPFVGATTMDTLTQVISEEPVRPRELRSDVPLALEAICLKCLEKHPARRYPTAVELADDLTRYAEGDTVSAVPGGLVGRLVGAMERVRLQERFAEYSSMLLALAFVMFLPEVWITVVAYYDWPGHIIAIGQYARVIAFLGVVGYYRGWNWQPRGAIERQLWLIWGGYLLCCFCMGLSSRIAAGRWDGRADLLFYPPLATLTALAFFAIAATFWGYGVLIAVTFLALAFVMAFEPALAPLEFGTAWAVVLILLSLRLRALRKTDD